ncbi:MAG TPA: ectonucleotide pyrophosphatase/phosphodiesterase [Rhizomicrobium sp.]|nr:ectonucleotide pyrophosphatase/phosphodiesterase [Rhizomicrobium sp.]
MALAIRAALAASFLAALVATGDAAPAPKPKLLVLSIDGLDWRYLRDRDALGLKIPNIRKILALSEVADGVTGVWPTITWPSHTSMITGVRPDQHGIASNAALPLDPALSYWSAKKIKVPTLTQCLMRQGRTTGAVNWPVTMDAQLTWNLPEAYVRRSGDSSDMDTVDRFGTPGLVAEIGRALPSFPQEWLDDRSRTLATVFLLKQKQPDLLLVHLAELDSAAHEEGPFVPHVNAVVERTDELIGDIVKAMPKNYRLALVSDHGFERIDHVANLKAMAAADGVTGEMAVTGGLVTTGDAKLAGWLRAQTAKGDVGREVPHGELMAYAPQLGGAVAAFEPAAHVTFGGAASGPAHAPPSNQGTHGFWPKRPDYHSIFLLSGPGVKPGALGEIEMLSLEKRFEGALGINCPG